MSRRATRAELADEVRSLSAYQEAFFCLRRGSVPQRLTSGSWSVELLGAERLSGGVVIDGSTVSWSNAYLARCAQSTDPYLRDLGHQIGKAITAALQRAS